MKKSVVLILMLCFLCCFYIYAEETPIVQESEETMVSIDAFDKLKGSHIISQERLSHHDANNIRLGDQCKVTYGNIDFKDGAGYVTFNMTGGYNGSFVDLYMDRVSEENKILDNAFLPTNHHEGVIHEMSFSIQPVRGVHNLILVGRHSTEGRWPLQINFIRFHAERPDNCEPYVHAQDKNVGVRDVFSDTWDATDDLGRSVLSDATPAPREDKDVIMFYFISNASELYKNNSIFDINKLLKENPENPKFPEFFTSIYWAEPYFGYYSSLDTWVIRKHATMLGAMGVDAICLDVTNQTSYDNVIMAIFETFAQMRSEGNNTPQIMFILPNDQLQTTRSTKHLYNMIYKDGKYEDLWYRFGEDNKPLMFGKYVRVGIEFRKFFEWRKNWAWSAGSNEWTWVAHTPQAYGYKGFNKDVPEEVSVSAAQHATTNIGRSFSNGKQPEHKARYGTDITTSGEGIYLAEQFASALTTDPQVLFLTAWNEWTAGLSYEPQEMSEFLGWPNPKNGRYAVDCFSPEYSRDMEPMRGDFYDNYYYQCAMNLRLFKGARKPFLPSDKKTVDINGAFSQWDDVSPEYRDYLFDNTHRGHISNFQDVYYEDFSGRNDIDIAKATYDEENLYFYVRTREPLTLPTEENYMVLYLDTTDSQNAWQGFDYVINRKLGVLEKSIGDWQWETVGEVSYKIDGRELMLFVPRKAVGLTGGVQFKFKWADNSQKDGTVYDFMTLGDTAPDLRYTYVFDAVSEDLVPQVIDDPIYGTGSAEFVLPTVDTKNLKILKVGYSGMFDNNSYKSIASPVYIEEDNYYVPLRAVTESMHCRVLWDAEQNTAIVSCDPFGEKQTDFVIGENAALVGGSTYVNAESLAKALQKSVYIDHENKIVLFGHSTRDLAKMYGREEMKHAVLEEWAKIK